MVHQVLLHKWITRSRSTRRNTGLFYNYFFILIYLYCASCAASQQGVAAADRAPDCYHYYYHYYYCLFELCIRCRSTTMESLQQTGHQTFLLFSIYFNLCELCIRCRSTTFSRAAIRGTRLFFFNIFVLIYFNFASAAAPQQEVAVPDGTPDFFVL
jgi:predicted nucleic-acid-binding Zn-ribbon protein